MCKAAELRTSANNEVRDVNKKETQSTRELLLFTGGELFSEHGYDGVSTRAIAEAAGVNLGSIHYHFGSKEKLYMEAFTFAIAEKRCNGFLEVLEENPMLAENPAGQAEIIRTAVYRNFHEFFRPEKPRWERQIIIREVTKPSTVAPILLEQVYIPDMDRTREFYKKIKPGAQDKEANAWMDMLHAQIIYYGALEDVLYLARGERVTDVDFYREAARTVSRAMILQLDLPLPKDLQ
ncbi:MAG: hypothetical protein CSB34_01585 [Desulfobulbus propionicus]|nr:MAG: hypothetical protein CSB34_01585 [Desulfobulbus propionicus]